MDMHINFLVAELKRGSWCMDSALAVEFDDGTRWDPILPMVSQFLLSYA